MRGNTHYPVDPVNDCISLFDAQFSVDELKGLISIAENSSSAVLDSAKEAVRKVFTEEESDSKYVVNISDDLREALRNGDVHFDKNKKGELYAQLRSPNGKYSDKLSISEELDNNDLSADAVILAMQMEAIRGQLDKIIDRLSRIETRMTEVIQGQRGDRIGLFYSGLSLFLEARVTNDESLRKHLIAQSLKAINDANSQMIQDIRTNISYLITEQYRKEKNREDMIEQRIDTIQQCYGIVYRSAILKAAIYQENGEIAAMLTALEEYGHFVEKMIIPYMGALSEFDKNSMLIGSGTWGMIASTVNECENLKESLQSSNTYYLSMKGEGDY